MKRTLICFALVLCLITTIALGEGKLKVTQKQLCTFPGDDNGYFFAKIENVGDAAIGLGSGSLVVFTEEDEIMFVKDYVSALPSGVMLQPGEYAYIREFLWESALASSTAGDFKFSVEENKYPTERKKIPCEVTFDIEGADSYENYIYLTFTNTEDEPKYNCFVTAALLDGEGSVVFANGNSLGSVAVHPGSTVTVKISIDHDMVRYFAANGIDPVSADGMVSFAVEK